MYAYTGDVDAAFEWLDRMAPLNPPMGFYSDPLFANLRDDPRWPALLERVAEPPEELAAIPFEVRLPR